MGVDEADALGLVLHRAQQYKQHRVLEYIGRIAGMEGVAVAEHPCLEGADCGRSIQNSEHSSAR